MKFKLLKLGELPIMEADNELGLRVQFTSLGASIYAIYFNNELMTLSPKTQKDFTRPDIYNGKTIGQIANRVENGLVEINGKQYQLFKNEGNNTLHGGDYATSRYLFGGKITNNNDVAFSIRYRYVKPARKDGLPDKSEYVVTYYLSAKDNTLLVDYRVRPDADTIISLTNHSYFNLGDNNINNLLLTIPASQYVESRKEDLIYQNIKEVPPCLDFRTRKAVIKDINSRYLQDHKSKGYDHCFILDEPKGKVILENNRTKMEIESNFDALQVYSDNYPTDIQYLKTNEEIHKALAIEPMDNPFNRNITKKKEYYHREITYKFFKK